MNTTLKTLSSVLFAGASFVTFNAQAKMFWNDNSISLLSNLSEFEVNEHKDVGVITLEH